MSEVNDIHSTITIERVLILGHSGYIGGRLQKFLCQQHPNMEIIGLSFPSLDLTKKEDVASISDFFDLNTAVIMLSGIKKQLGDTLDIFAQNMAMVENICRLLQEQPVKRFVYISSAEVYGEATNNTTITEETPVQPSSYYGISKYASEGLLQKVIAPQEGSTLLILRPTLVYGPGEQGTFYGPSGFVRTALKEESITLWGSGNELREFLYIDDLVKSVTGLTFYEYDGVVNMVSGKSCSFKESLDIIVNLMPNPINVSSRPRSKPKVDQAYNNKKLAELLPGISFTSLEEGIKNVFNAEREAGK